MTTTIARPDVSGAPQEAQSLHHHFVAMASEVRFTVTTPVTDAAVSVALAEGVFRRVEASCTRFDPDSPLMRANADGRAWHTVPVECVAALGSASKAHRETDGLFDPRMLDRLVALGYDRSLPFASGDVERVGTGTTARPVRRRWRPGIDVARNRIRVGAVPVDLGGIGKGLAVRWAGRLLRGAGSAALVEAGGDCLAIGKGPDGEGWRIAVEHPAGGADPVAVLEVRDRGVATSSTRLRRWSVGGRSVHHLLDPRTGDPANSGLLSVTVVDADPARAEVWSKALFVAGADEIATVAAEHDLPALWVQDDGRVRTSAAVRPLITWQVHRVR